MIHFSPAAPFDSTSTTLDQYVENLYQMFLDELINKPLYWKTRSTTVSLRRHEEVAGRHASFWHLVSGGSATDIERNVELERCRRIGWIRPMVEAFNHDYPSEKNIKWWVSPDPRWRGRRYVLATENFDYVLFVEERRGYALVVTAYFVEIPRRRNKFKKQHDDFWEIKQGSPA